MAVISSQPPIYSRFNDILQGIVSEAPFTSLLRHVYQITVFVATVLGGGTYREAVDQAFVDVIAHGRLMTEKDRQSLIEALSHTIPGSFRKLTSKPTLSTHGVLWSVFKHFQSRQPTNKSSTFLYEQVNRVFEECGLENVNFEKVNTLSWFNPAHWSTSAKQGRK